MPMPVRWEIKLNACLSGLCHIPCRKEIVSGLAVTGAKPQYRGTTLVASSGPLTVAADMPDGAGIH